jgi:uncharacterized protein (DUF2147 family)
MRAEGMVSAGLTADKDEGLEMNARALFASVALLATPLAAGAAPSETAHGYWLTENRKAIVQIAPCGGDTCGRMVWVENPLDASGKPKRDDKNADAAKRARTICGLELVGGLVRTDDGKWSDGWLYNPRNGETYSAEIRPLSPFELEVRGFLGVSLLGKSQVWTRVGDDRGGCSL